MLAEYFFLFNLIVIFSMFINSFEDLFNIFIERLYHISKLLYKIHFPLKVGKLGQEYAPMLWYYWGNSIS